ncbi:hypothetical protein PGT21_005424 [Puccinia graminis f. sp. tritici]|uniref:Uncharacterized protein n=1 Tax=Puccinia graminis f. sp. tritici TaxID=56615 RepID=A0A5B0PQT5_PUCGR|nr:hypothetical protein PGT21_005424 [Puccinia graminis f. sp. tritici]
MSISLKYLQLALLVSCCLQATQSSFISSPLHSENAMVTDNAQMRDLHIPMTVHNPPECSSPDRMRDVWHGHDNTRVVPGELN